MHKCRSLSAQMSEFKCINVGHECTKKQSALNKHTFFRKIRIFQKKETEENGSELKNSVLKA